MSNSSVFNIWATVPNSLQDLQLNEREFQTAGERYGLVFLVFLLTVDLYIDPAYNDTASKLL